MADGEDTSLLCSSSSDIEPVQVDELSSMTDSEIECTGIERPDKPSPAKQRRTITDYFTQQPVKPQTQE